MFEGIPEEYKKHLPKENKSIGEAAVEVASQASRAVKESLQRIYAVASQPIGAPEPIRPRPRETDPLEYYASLAARIVALPIVAIRDVIESGEASLVGAGKLIGGPRGELGQWTPEQQAVEADALNLTLGAMAGGMPGGGIGPANIGRKEALRALAKDFRALAKNEGKKFNLEEFVRTLWENPSFQMTKEEFMKPQLPRKESFRTIAKGIHKLPQEVLDLADKVGLTTERGKYGYFEYNPTTKKRSIMLNPIEETPPGTVFHEFGHALQYNTLGRKSFIRMPNPVLEAQAYEFENLVEIAQQGLGKGKRLSPEQIKEFYKEATQSAIKKYGPELRSWSAKKVLNERDLMRQLRRLAKEGLTPKQTIDSPLGKLRFEGIQPGFADYPDTYMFTFQEGLAKGSTFVSKSGEMPEILKAGNELLEVWKNYKPEVGE